MSARTTQHIPAYISGKINNHQTQLLLDLGASCSVVSRKHVNANKISPEQSVQLINADGRSFAPLGTSPATVTLGQLSVNHTFLVVEKLSVPVILGCDFMSKHAIVLDIQGGTAYQLGSGHKMNLDTQVAKPCNPLIIDDELPQALPSKSNGPCYSCFMAVLLSSGTTSKEEAAGLAAHMHLVIQSSKDLEGTQ